MKKIFKTLLFACTVALVSVSCDSDENSHSYNGPFQTYYDQANYSISAMDTDNNTTNLVVVATTASATDRQISLSVDPASTAVLGDDFTMASTVTIPANSYTGTVAVTSNFTSNTLAGVQAIINITDDSAAQFKNSAVVNIQHRSCDPVDAPAFTGLYAIEQVAGSNGFGDSFNDAQVELFDNGTDSRVFQVGYLIGAPLVLELNFDCSFVTIEPTEAPVTCGGAITLSNAPAGSEGTYMPADDSEFYFTYTETIPEGCTVAQSAVITYKFTKI